MHKLELTELEAVRANTSSVGTLARQPYLFSLRVKLVNCRMSEGESEGFG